MKKISVIGIGRLGLCFALNIERTGLYEVIGVDIDRYYIDALNKKTFNSDEPLVNNFLQNSKNFRATTNVWEAMEADIIFIIVPTPSSESGVYDHTYINRAIDSLLKFGKQERKKKLVIQSTTTPGYCQSLHERVWEYNYEVVYNPEFIAQGTIINDQINPDFVLIGANSPETRNEIAAIYADMCKSGISYSKMNLTEAELTKIALNCFITTKIAFANTVGDVAKNLNCDGNVILDAIGMDKRIGPRSMKYGFGYGGPCFPRDNRAFGVVCEMNGVYPHIPYATDHSNKSHLLYQLNEYLTSVKTGEEIILEDLAYKKGTTIITESQKLRLAVDLSLNGYKVTLKDVEPVINKIKTVYGDTFHYIIEPCKSHS